jgi:pilus assembly protein CpaE
MSDAPEAATAGRSGRSGGAAADRSVVVAALLHSQELVTAVREAMAGDGQILLRAKHVPELDATTLAGLEGDVLLVDLDVDNRQEISVLAGFVANPNSPPVVVTSSRLDVAAMRQLMHIGILDVVPQPIDAAELMTAIRQAAARQAPKSTAAREERGKVVGFIGSCGGVGVTSLAVQGACAIARHKGAPSLCLLDLDIQFGNAALLLDLEQRGGIFDLIHAPERLDGALLRAAMVRAHDRFDLLGAPSTVYGVDNIDPAAIGATIATASHEYARVLIDVPLLWSHWTHAALRAADAIVLVVQMTVPSLRHGRRQIDMLRQEELDDIPLFIVANRVATGLFGSTSGVSQKPAETALGHKIDFIIPESPAMKAAAEAGRPISEVSGGRALEKKLEAMMEGILRAGSAATASLKEAGD